MNVKRADIVLVDYPFTSGSGSKVRPALVIQNDKDNQRLTNTIIVQITTVSHRALEPTQVLIDIVTPDGQRTGLRQTSVANCVNLATIDRNCVLRTIGILPDPLLLKVVAALKIALELP